MKSSITGMGIVSPAGIGKDDFYKSLATGTSGVIHYESSPVVDKAGVIQGFKLKQFTKNVKQVRPLSKASHFAIAAVKEAAEDAAFASLTINQHKAGVIVGTTRQFTEKNTASLVKAYDASLNEKGDFDLLQFAGKGIRQLSTKMLLPGAPNISTFICNYELGTNGYSSTIVSESNASFDAFIEADMALVNDMADAIFCGATDSLVGVQNIINLVPLNAKQQGDCDIIPGEGAAFFLFEKASNARQKGRYVYADMLSCTSTYIHCLSDITSNIGATLHQAGVAPDDIDVIVGSQDAVPFFSQPVMEAIAGCFEHNSTIPIRTSLPYVGYTRTAVGAFDLALAIFILETGRIPALLQSDQPYGGHPLYGEHQRCIKQDCRTVLLVSIGLTGCVYSAIIRKPER